MQIDNQATLEPQDQNDEEETYQRRYDSLKGKFNKMTAEFAEMKNYMATLTAQAQNEPEPEDEDSVLKQQILDRLNEDYPEELIENLRALQRLEAKEIARQYIQPVKQQAESLEEMNYAQAQSEFVEYLNAKSTKWSEVWSTAVEMANGEEPSDPRIAAFLNAPDPNGLGYTNLELLQTYEDRWDADRFLALVGLYENAQTPQRSNYNRDAQIAPSRVKTQPIPQSQEKRTWTMAEFNQFTKDAHNDKYDPDTKAQLWLEFQTALAEGRIR
jgi:hypothetical protein